MRVARSAVGPLLVGVAVWCAAGEITTLSPDSAATRLVVPAAWWWAAVGFLLALALPAWRRQPLSAWPAILATVAWWPIPLPPIALIWTGPLAWVPIGLAVATALAATGQRATRDGAAGEVLSDARSPIRLALLAGGFSLAASVLVAIAVAPRVPGGDEPHYLIVTDSLLKDGDLRIQNNHDRRDYASYFGGDLPRPDMIQRGRNGEAYSIHAPGVSALVLPAFSVFGYPGAQATVAVCVAFASGLLWMIGWRATRDRGAAWFVWAAIAGSATVLIQSVTVFPDGPGVLGVAAAVWLLTRLTADAAPRTAGPSISGRSIVGVSVALAALPWLHTRFVILAVALGVLVVGQWVFTSMPMKAKVQAIAKFLALPAMSAAIWFGFFKVIYGTFNPAAPYGAVRDSSAAFIPGGMLGLLFDQQFGLFAYAPVLLAAAGGLFGSHRDAMSRLGRRLLVVGLAYGGAVGMYWMWWAGLPAPPARFATAVLPLLAVPLALAWTRATLAGRRCLGLLLSLSLAISAVVVAVDHGALLWNMRDAHAQWLDWAGPVVSLARGLPSFFWDLNPVSPSGEWPFVRHVAATLALVMACTATVSAYGRRREIAPARVVSGVVALMVLTVMAILQAGWWLNRVNGLNPIASQVQTLRAISGGRQAVVVSPGYVAAWRRTSAPVVLEVGKDRLFEEGDAPLAVERLPAGDYEVELLARRTAPVDVLVNIEPSAPQMLAFRGLSQVRRAITLPAGAERVTFTLDTRLRAVGTRVRIWRHAQ